VRRREFITLIGSAAVGWPLGARAQQADRVRRVGALMNFSSDDPEGKARFAAFAQAMVKLGWIEDSTLHIEARWAADDVRLYRQYAEELVAVRPDVILAGASPSVAALQQASRTVPIVFANLIDPVGAGFVTTLARPGGNTTGFTAFEYSLSGKWLGLLREIAPNATRIAVLRDPALAASIGQFAAIQSASSSSGVELSAVDIRDPGEIDRALVELAREPKAGVIVTACTAAVTHRDLIISLAIRHRLPNVYGFRYYPENGGLASYGPLPADEYAGAAIYVDRILKGEKPANLPVQAPVKYELVINLKTAKALKLDVPPSVLARADEVIE
jgi:putative tryptophan/tyrosine transport system substrate-binding protein